MKKLALYFFVLVLFSAVVSAQTTLFCDAMAIEFSDENIGFVDEELYYGEVFTNCDFYGTSPFENYMSLGVFDAKVLETGYLQLTFLDVASSQNYLFGKKFDPVPGAVLTFMEEGYFKVVVPQGQKVVLWDSFYLQNENVFFYDLDPEKLNFYQGYFSTIEESVTFLIDDLDFYGSNHSDYEVIDGDLFVLLNEVFDCKEDLEKEMTLGFVYGGKYYSFVYTGCSGRFSVLRNSVMMENSDGEFEEIALALDLYTVGYGDFNFVTNYGSFPFYFYPGNYLLLDVFENGSISGRSYLQSDDLEKDHLNFCDNFVNTGTAFLSGEGKVTSVVEFVIDRDVCYPTTCTFTPYDDSDYSLTCGTDYPRFEFSNSFLNTLYYEDYYWSVDEDDAFGIKANMLGNFEDLGFFKDFSDSSFMLHLTDELYLEDIIGFRSLQEFTDGYAIDCDSFVVNGVRFSSFSSALLDLEGNVYLTRGGVVYDKVRDLGFMLDRGEEFVFYVSEGVDRISACGTVLDFETRDLVLEGVLLQKLANNELYDSEVYVVSRDSGCELSYLNEEGIYIDEGYVVSEEDDFSQITEKYFPYSNHPKSVGAPTDYALMQAIKYVGGYDSITKDPSCCGDYLSMLYKSLGYNYVYEKIGAYDSLTNTWTSSKYATLEEMTNVYGSPPIGYSDDRGKSGHALMLLGYDSEATWWLEQIPDVGISGRRERVVYDGEALTISFTGDNLNRRIFNVYPKNEVYTPGNLVWVYPWQPLCYRNTEYLVCPDTGVDTTWRQLSFSCEAGNDYVWAGNQAGAGDGDPWSRYWEPSFSPYYPHSGVC